MPRATKLDGSHSRPFNKACRFRLTSTRAKKALVPTCPSRVSSAAHPTPQLLNAALQTVTCHESTTATDSRLPPIRLSSSAVTGHTTLSAPSSSPPSSPVSDARADGVALPPGHAPVLQRRVVAPTPLPAERRHHLKPPLTNSKAPAPPPTATTAPALPPPPTPPPASPPADHLCQRLRLAFSHPGRHPPVPGLPAGYLLGVLLELPDGHPRPALVL
jgi:hypothetical protein